MTELTAHRTLALRDALANEPERRVPGGAARSCVSRRLLPPRFRHLPGDCGEERPASAVQAPGLADSASALAIEARQSALGQAIARGRSGDLWDALTAFDGGSRTALFAHCAALTVNVVERRP